MESAYFGYCPCGCVASDNRYGLCDECNEMLCLDDEHNLNHVDCVEYELNNTVEADYLP